MLRTDDEVQHQFKIHPDKFVLIKKNIEWGGKMLSTKGLPPALHNIVSLYQRHVVVDHPEPDHAFRGWGGVVLGASVALR